jgi:hypothetical protein
MGSREGLVKGSGRRAAAQRVVGAACVLVEDRDWPLVRRGLGCRLGGGHSLLVLLARAMRVRSWRSTVPPQSSSTGRVTTSRERRTRN